MTKEQEHDIDNALLTLMYEWKTGMIDQRQALKEFKQCIKYYAIVENVIAFHEDQLKDLRIFEHYGEEKTTEYIKRELSEKIMSEVVKKECISFEELPTDYRHPSLDPCRHFRMKLFAIIPGKPLLALLLIATLFSSCLPSRTPSGDYWPSWDVYHCVLAGNKDPRTRQLECPPKP